FAWSPDGQAWLYATKDGVRRYRLDTGEDAVLTNQYPVYGLAPSIDGKRLYMAEGVAHVRRELITNFPDLPRVYRAMADPFFVYMIRRGRPHDPCSRSRSPVLVNHPRSCIDVPDRCRAQAPSRGKPREPPAAGLPAVCRADPESTGAPRSFTRSSVPRSSVH